MKKILISFLGVFLILTTGCDQIDNNPTKQVEDLMSKYQTMDDDVKDDLNTVIDTEENLNDEQRSRYKKLLEKQYKDLSYTIKDETIDGDNAIVEVEIQVTDLSKAMSEAEIYLDEHENEFLDDANQFSQEKYTDYKLQKLEEADTKVKYTLELTLTKVDDEWEVDNLTETERQKIHGIYNY
ncbi:MAG: hypothetical protein IJO32_06260 [Bacilli bacterium]|nr:hypothetical protein [Bacilli bacterium]